MVIDGMHTSEGCSAVEESSVVVIAGSEVMVGKDAFVAGNLGLDGIVD